MSKVLSFSISDRYLNKIRSLYPELTENLAAKQFLIDQLDAGLDDNLDNDLDDKLKTIIETSLDGILDERLDATVGKLITSLSERMARLEERLDDSLDGRLDDMERLLKLQQSASIASPLPTREPSPLPPSPSLPPDKLGKGGNGDIFPDSPPSPPDAIEDPEKKIVDFPDTLIASPIENVESVESISSINEPDTDAIESLTSESDSSIEGEDAIETVTPEVSPSPPLPPDAIESLPTVESVEPISTIEPGTDAIETVPGDSDSIGEPCKGMNAAEAFRYVTKKGVKVSEKTLSNWVKLKQIPVTDKGDKVSEYLILRDGLYFPNPD